jgi:glycosyltransferase involved in cell wall biosynthesis
MSAIGSKQEIRVFVHLAHGFGAQRWQQRLRCGEVVGLIDHLPYGYFWAREEGCAVTYSEDEDETVPWRLLRMGVRWVLGFDFVHAWRNRSGIFDADVVWTHTESQHLAVLLLLLTRPKQRRPKLIAQSVWLFDRWPHFLWLRRLLYRWLLSRADLLTVHSPDNLRRARELFPETRSELVLFGIKTDTLRALHRRPVGRPIHLLSLGNDEHRDWETAIAAARGWEDSELRIVSPRVIEKHLKDIVNVTKAVPRSMPELEALYEWADIVVVAIKPNLHASGITVVLEATVFGLPVICTDTGGLRAYFSDDEIRYVPPRDAAELRRAIADLAADEERRWTLVEHARAQVVSQDLSSRAYARKHAELSRQLLSAPLEPPLQEQSAHRKGYPPLLQQSRRLRGVWAGVAMLMLAVIGLTFFVRAAEPERSQIGNVALDLCGFRPTFVEDFNSLSVSSHPEEQARWFAHTPWGGDFGDAAFADPQPDFPFSVRNGILRIEARKTADGKWHSGLLASARPDGTGFAQRYGYFEVRAKLPSGPGVWPAFWLNANQPHGAKDPSVEIDVLEYYGQFPDGFHSVLHVWDNSGSGNNRVADHVTPVVYGSLYRDFHTYGVDVEPDWVTFYLDRRETWRVATPAELTKPLMVLVNLALGSGWPIDQTPNPSIMEIDYVHAYERDSAERRTNCG